jgi:hypothetical protein
MAAAAPTALRVDGYSQYGTPAHLGAARGGWVRGKSANRQAAAGVRLNRALCPPTVRIDWEKVIGGLGPGCRAIPCDQAASWMVGVVPSMEGGGWPISSPKTIHSSKTFANTPAPASMFNSFRPRGPRAGVKGRADAGARLSGFLVTPVVSLRDYPIGCGGGQP